MIKIGHMFVNDFVKKARKQRKLTQAQLAGEFNRTVVSKLERGTHIPH